MSTCPLLRSLLRAIPWVLTMGSLAVVAADRPVITGVTLDKGGLRLDFEPFPATVEYQLQRAASPDLPFGPNTLGVLGDFEWMNVPATDAKGFFRVVAQTLPPEELHNDTLLSRIAYGPTPDEEARLRTIGPAAYLEEQLAPETIPEDLDQAAFTPTWRKVAASGLGSASALFIYLDGAGETYLDDIRLVAGPIDDGTQPNLLRDGDFETALGADWVISTNLVGSALTPDVQHGGDLSLHIVSSAAGTTQASSIYQLISPALVKTKTYTLSYWYLTSATETAQLSVRLSGSGIVTKVPLKDSNASPAPIFDQLTAGTAVINDLRAWHVLHAVQSRRQLSEVLRQFWENHFVTEYTKEHDYFNNAGLDSVVSGQVATQLEFAENIRWREAMLKPQCTFLDLLRISAESPAMIIYLDTVGSRGNGSNIANENYARELSELFTFGVDNGYDQADIVQISRVWTGWSIRLVANDQTGNPFAPTSTNYLDPNALTNRTALTNLIGTWAFNYKSASHNNTQKKIFFQHDAAGAVTTPKLVPARFGPPWAGRDYSLVIPAGSGTNSIQEGYTLLTHMANQPFAEEFISVKLCRLFVHDDFAIGYDFTDAATTPEEDLVHACMLAWENPANGGPKGQLRDILRVILNSELFRSNAGSLQKIKTPLEFNVSVLRALRARKDDGSYTATTDGYGLLAGLSRMGRMLLFDRMEPNGYPEDGPAWISAGTLAERLRFVQAALMPAGMTGKSDGGTATMIDPVALLRLKVPGNLGDAGAIADYFLGLLFPAEGGANLGAFHRITVDFLNTDDDGKPSPLTNLTPGTSAYDLRIRGTVALLMTTQRFEEQ